MIIRRARLSTYCLLVALVVGTAPRTAIAQPCSPARIADIAHGCQDSVAIELRLEWQVLGAIKLNAAGQLDFPDVGAVPGIYRFDLRTGSDRAVYIGESKNLRQRFYQYRLPGGRQTTNHRICLEMRRALAGGGSVEVSLVKEARFCAAAVCTKADLAFANHRRLFEQLALLPRAPNVRAPNSEHTGSRTRKERKFLFCS